MRKLLFLLALPLLALSCNAQKPADQQNPPQTAAEQNQTNQTQTADSQSATPSGKKPQFVVMAFDGSYSLEMWQNTLDFSEQMKLQGHPVHFTYFLSGVYFLNWRKASRYQPPKHPAGTSQIGFAAGNLDIKKRVAYVNRGIALGDEMGSHLNGHFNGSTWTQEEWQQEFDQFKKLVFSIPENNDVSPQDAPDYTINLKPDQMFGYRAPELGRNSAMYTVLKDEGYAYDTSAVAAHPTDWPSKLPNGLWEFPLASIKYAGTKSNILSMDYNFYFKQSGAKDVAKYGDQQWQQFYNDTFKSFMDYFNGNYNGDRAPVFIGSHFSKWNDGVYWQAMKDFAAEACSKPEVRCVTFSELKDYLDSQQ